MKLLSVISLFFAILYNFFTRGGVWQSRISDALFILGIVYLCIGLLTYVRNVGMFKLLAYYRYKRRQKNLIKAGVIEDKVENIKELYEFAEEEYSERWDGGIFYKFGLPLLLASLLLALL